MNIGAIIKKYRRERNMTQDQLAEYLNVTVSAVSQWENEKTTPDISVIPPLCNLLGITSDKLLGIDIEKTQEKIIAIYTEANRYSGRGYYEKAREILEAGLREYPNSCDLMFYLMYLAYWQHNYNTKETDFSDEAIRLGEAILEKSTDDSLRHGAIQILCFTYKDAGRKNEAKKLARSMPPISVSSEMLLSNVCDGDEGYRAKQIEASDLLQFLSNRLYSMQEKLDSGKYVYTETELASLREKRIALINLFFENGDFGFYHCHLCETHTAQAVYYAKIGDSEKAISNLQAAAEHAIGFVTSGSGDPYTSLVFRGMNRGSWSVSSTDNDAARLLKQLDDAVFDKIRVTSEFAEIKEKLKTYADKWQIK